MLVQDINRIVGKYLYGLAMALMVPFLLALYYEYGVDPSLHPQPHSTLAFLLSISVTLLLGFLFCWSGRYATGHMYRREGLAAVVFIWFLTPALAGLPFVFSGTFSNPLHAYFEAASGFTTTGISCMEAKKFNEETGKEIPIQKSSCGEPKINYTFWGTIDPVRDPKTGKILYGGVEAVGKALLFWRSFTQWLGGMGIVVLFVAVLPVLGVGGKVLFQAEVPGPIKDTLTPRIKETALQLWKIYAGISILQIILLLLTNHDMGIYDAFTITFSTMSTGGLSSKNTSIEGFNNAYTEWVVIVFMFVGSINFSLYFYALKGKFYRIYEPEFFLFVILVVFGSAFTAWYLLGTEKILLTGEQAGIFSLKEAIRYGAFQVISAISTTGFATLDPNFWPYPVQTLMLIFMFIGGMSGSTAGGMKVVRLSILFKIVLHKVETLFSPQSIRSFKIGDREIDKGVAMTVLVFFVVLISISVLGGFLYILEGIDPYTSLSLVTLMINNTGLGFGMASPTGSCAFLSDFGLILSSLLMLFGRLEFLAVLAILVPAFWRQT